LACPVGQGHEVSVGSPGGVEFVGSFFEFLAQVEELLFELADAGVQGFGPVGGSEAAGTEDFVPEELRQAGGEAGVLPLKPLGLFLEVGQVGEQRLPARLGRGRAGSGVGCPGVICARRSWWR
jgi:hypothetical protein